MNNFNIKCNKCGTEITLEDEFSRNRNEIVILKLNYTLNFECRCGNSIYEDNVNEPVR